MMRKLLILCTVFIGCTNTETKNTSKSYYDLANIINQQIANLSSQKPLVEKKLVIADKTETLQTKDINWNKELELFLQADLNKQSYQARYNIQQKDNTVTYTLKEGEDLPVKELVIEFDEVNNPKYIGAKIQTSNYLYESDKMLSAQLNKNQLLSYHIKGWQKLFIGSKKNFNIKGKVKALIGG